MNDAPRPLELLAGGGMAVDTVAWQVSRVGSPFAALVRAAAALRNRREAGIPVVSVGRICAAKESLMEQRGQGAAVLWPLRRQALPDDRRASMGDQGTGAGRHLFTKNKQVPL